jgi:predicted polyphosphate/ATP-dependent NAD kinase
VAGLGGAVALKGSDGQLLQQSARQRGAEPKANLRCASFLRHLAEFCPQAIEEIIWTTWQGSMGADNLREGAWNFTVAGGAAGQTSSTDTRLAATQIQAEQVDCIVFVGGDGTATDMLAAVHESVPVIGIPAGVKMHSGVFAVSPRTAAKLLAMLVGGEFVARRLAEVRDYDQQGSDETDMQIRIYGEMCVPDVGGYLQQTKVGGKESEPLALQEICAGVLERLPPDRNLVLAPGSTCLAIKAALGLDGTLRGCDVLPVQGEALLDAMAAQLEGVHNPVLVVSFTRQQGFLFGRGNQQLSARFLNQLNWPEDVYVVASRTKLLGLQQRPLLLDTGDDQLDEKLSGLVEVITGYEDSLLYRLSGQAV